MGARQNWFILIRIFLLYLGFFSALFEQNTTNKVSELLYECVYKVDPS